MTINKKGFTLMELLAVIVLLAIIATIAIPIFLKAISKSKETSFERRADLYVEAAEVAIATENLDGNFDPEECVVQENGNIKCDNDKVLEVEMKGDKPTYGTLTISGGKVTSFVNLKFESDYVTMESNGKYTVSDEKSVKVITFSFKLPSEKQDMEYQAEEGTTWEEFLSTNMVGIYGAFLDNIYYLINLETNEEVLISDEIENGGRYSYSCKSTDSETCTHGGGTN